MNSTNLQQIFEELSKFKITRYQAQTSLFILAKAVWQENFNPDMSRLEKDTEQRRGAYMIDFFSRFHHVTEIQKKQLRKQLEVAQKQLPERSPEPHITFYPYDTPGRDRVAHLWGLANGMRPAKVPGLLDLQRRAQYLRQE